MESDKDRKAREKAEKKEQQERDKKDREHKLLITRTLAKIVMPMVKLETALNSPGVDALPSTTAATTTMTTTTTTTTTPGADKIPSACMDIANGLMQKLGSMKKTAERINKNKLQPSAFTWTAQEVNDASTQAAAQAQLVVTMAKSIQLAQ